MEEHTLNEYERIRREKMQALKDKGIDPLVLRLRQPIIV